jgi:hypothetical protein
MVPFIPSNNVKNVVDGWRRTALGPKSQGDFTAPDEQFWSFTDTPEGVFSAAYNSLKALVSLSFRHELRPAHPNKFADYTATREEESTVIFSFF